MADAGIRRPVEFEHVFTQAKDWKLIDRFTELVVLAAYVGFHAEREGRGPFHNPVQWQYFTPEEKNALFALGIAHTMHGGKQADPEIIGVARRKDFFTVVEAYVHGGLLEMREQGAFADPTRIGYGTGLATFVHRALKDESAGAEEVRVQDLLRDLRDQESQL